MTQAIMGSRKRLRSNNCEEECCDFMPLSKRINNLHINNGTCCAVLGHNLSKQEGLYEPSVEQWNPVAPAGESESLNYLLSERECQSQAGRPQVDPVGASHGSHMWMSEQILCQYSPSLSASDNPHYYETNKLLFALYMERLQRTGEALY